MIRFHHRPYFAMPRHAVRLVAATGTLLLLLFVQGFCSPVRYQGLALVLSGGGARGLSQIGVIMALEEAGIRPDLIVGTSMGAIIGSLYAAGYDPESIVRIVDSVDWDDMFANTASRKKMFVSQKNEPINYLFELRFNDRLEPIPPNSVSHGQAFYTLLGPRLSLAQFRCGSDFNRLPIRLRIVATDLVTGKRVVLSSGNLAEAVRASSSVPLAFSPVAKDSMLLLDGGLTANIPVSVAREEGALLTVAVDVTSPLWNRSHLDNPVYLMDQVVSISGKSRKEENLTQADLLIRPDLEGFANTDFGYDSTLVARGYLAMRDALDTLHRLLADKKSAPAGPTDLNTTPPAMGDSTTITAVRIAGNVKTSTSVIHTASGIKTGDRFFPDAHKKAVIALYSTDLFNNVNIELDSAAAVRIMVNEKQYWRVRMGLRYDEFHLGEGFLQPAYENLFGRGVLARFHLQYGLRREKYAFDLQGNHLFSTNFANSAKLQTYVSTERIFTEVPMVDTTGIEPDTTIWHSERNLQKSGVLGLLGFQIGRSAMLSSGIHLEFYKVQAENASAFQNVWGMQFLPYALLRLAMDSMDKFPFPTSGIQAQLSVRGTNRQIGGTSTFFKIESSFRNALTVARRHTVSPHLRVAWASSPLPQVEKAYLGGSFPEETLQDMEIHSYIPFLGLRPRSLSGDIMGVFHCGYTYRLLKSLYLVAGMDYGYVWDQESFPRERILRNFFRNAPVGAGVGLAVPTIVGPVRCSYGKLLHDFNEESLPSDDMFYFSAGYDF